MTGEDEYEKRYMGGDAIVYQAKAKAPALFHFIVLAPTLFSALVLGFASMAPNAPAWLPVMILPAAIVTFPMWLLFSVLRATVTRSHVHIQYGLFGPKIPLEKIEACEAVSYDWKRYGGFGIRRGRDGSWAYNMMGDQGRAVKLRWKDESGKEVTTLVSASDPDAFVRSVAKAKAGTRASKPKVRVDAPSAEAIAEAERELDAEFESDERRAKK
jgi:hypothetical protein